MAFAIKRPPPLDSTNFHPFLAHIFSFAIASYYYETDLTPGPNQNQPKLYAKKRFDSQGIILKVFFFLQKNIFEKKR